MKKIMILGSAGMLGHMVYNYLRDTNEFEIVDTSFPIKANANSVLLDVTDRQAVENYILAERPDVVVNCIGILIKSSQTDPSNAIYLNSYFPHQLSKILRKTGGKLIHISTDCVFSGKKGGGYADNDFRDADDIYGRSKALGEVINEKDLTIRTSIIGPELNRNGEGLFHWFMQQSNDIQGYTEAYWGGVTTLQAAKAIKTAIIQELSGLIHLTNGEKISKYQLLLLLKETYRKDRLSITPYQGKTVDKSLKISENFNFNVPSYQQMLSDQFKWMSDNSALYSGIYQ